MKNKNGYTLSELLIVIVITCMIIPLVLWTGRNLDFWISFFKHKSVHVPFWLSLLLTLFSGGTITVLNIIGEIARYFI